MMADALIAPWFIELVRARSPSGLVRFLHQSATTAAQQGEVSQ